MLTDGEVYNPQEVYNVINKYVKDDGKDKVFTFGIGNDSDKTLVTECAKYGRGDFSIVRDLQKLNE